MLTKEAIKDELAFIGMPMEVSKRLQRNSFAIRIPVQNMELEEVERILDALEEHVKNHNAFQVNWKAIESNSVQNLYLNVN